MPLTNKGKKIESAMEKEYGEKKGKQVFYASKNKGTIKGVEEKKKEVAKRMKRAADKDQDKRHKYALEAREVAEKAGHWSYMR